MSHRWYAGLSSLACVAVALTGCGQQATVSSSAVSSSKAASSSPGATRQHATVDTATPAAPSTATPRTEKWVDLRVGDCVAEVPAVDLGAVTVDTVDCSGPHRAEVYLLAPIEVNAAVTDVANHVCSTGLTPYAGSAAAQFVVTYLIDSRQDRTSDNPLPSTVICLLQAADQHALTGSAHR